MTKQPGINGHRYLGEKALLIVSSVKILRSISIVSSSSPPLGIVRAAGDQTIPGPVWLTNYTTVDGPGGTAAGMTSCQRIIPLSSIEAVDCSITTTTSIPLTNV